MSRHYQYSDVAAAAAASVVAHEGVDDRGQAVESVAVLQAVDARLVSVHNLHTTRHTLRNVYNS